MGIHAEDARDEEEMWADLKAAHKAKVCNIDTCPYCNEDFVPLFSFQCLEDEDADL